MSYERHTWIDGETITEEKLNNIEDGIEEASQSGGGTIVLQGEMDGSDCVFPITWRQAKDAMDSGTVIILKCPSEYSGATGVVTGMWTDVGVDFPYSVCCLDGWRMELESEEDSLCFYD